MLTRHYASHSSKILRFLDSLVSVYLSKVLLGINHTSLTRDLKNGFVLF